VTPEVTPETSQNLVPDIVSDSKVNQSQNGVFIVAKERKAEHSQASDVGSIPIARSINPDDSVDLTRLSYLNTARNYPILDGSWTVLKSIGRSY
jgi:hypothetical protein